MKDRIQQLKTLPYYAHLPETDQLSALPFSTREDLTTWFKAGLLKDPRAVRIHLTPNPGGAWLPEYESKNDIVNHAKAGAKALHAAGVRSGQAAQVAFGYHRFAGGWIFQDAFEELCVATLPFGPGETEAQLDSMQSLGVEVLVSAPSFAEKLGLAGARPKTLIAGGEPFTSIAGLRERVEAALQCTALDCYASSEAGMMALETTAKNGLKVLSDWVYLEVIDPETGAVLPDGERGELVITHLHKEVMPLVRFRTGDLTVIEHRSDGVFLPQGVFGNVGGMLKVKGIKLYPKEVAFMLAGLNLDFRNYQLTVKQVNGADRLFLTSKAEANQKDTIAEAFQKRFGFKLDGIELSSEFEGGGIVDERY